MEKLRKEPLNVWLLILRTSILIWLLSHESKLGGVFTLVT